MVGCTGLLHLGPPVGRGVMSRSCGQSVPDRGGSKCKGPEASMAGLIQGMAGEERKMRSEKVTEPGYGRHCSPGVWVSF